MVTDNVKVDLSGAPQTMLATFYAKALDADLPAERLPVKQQGRAAIRGQLGTLSAVEIRIESEAVRAMALQ